jgi:hypothetical protein
MHIAVFGDLHGHILLALKRCQRWQEETGQQLDLILQVGDLGVFPDPTRLDAATRRHGKSNPAVLSFAQCFMRTHPEVVTVLSAITCNMLFVRGNHEDHTWLDALEQQATEPCFAVDINRRLWCLKTGLPYTFVRGNEVVTILGIGRIGRPVAAKKARAHYIQPDEQQRLEHLGEMSIDILLTHDSQQDSFYLGSGSQEISQAVLRHSPQYHFFGRYGGPTRYHWEATTDTHCFKPADLAEGGAQQDRALSTGAMGLLCWHSRTDHAFEIITES